jgi:hypothetical protein
MNFFQAIGMDQKSDGIHCSCCGQATYGLFHWCNVDIDKQSVKKKIKYKKKQINTDAIINNLEKHYGRNPAPPKKNRG